jgi:HPt (histidine-containing phosphotransfer) domain-containing protein
LLERLLRKLAADWPQYDETLSVDVTRDTLQELIRVTHSLKGICGTLGANEVRDHASRVNLALLKLDPDDTVMLDLVRTDLRAFKLAMRTLTAAVHQHLGHSQGDSAANDV